MQTSFGPINPKFPHMLHGGDYNPEQWAGEPSIWDEDMRLMKLAHCNAMALGIFSWAALEPEEGRFEFGWLDDIMDRLEKNGAKAILATPSGAKPAWLSMNYPQTCRMNEGGNRDIHVGRHNFCRTDPLMREKTAEINTRLAERYRSHPALLIWHVSNEYSGNPCHCEKCLRAFGDWLKRRYVTLDALNRAWWTTFWSHTFFNWDQIRTIDNGIHGMQLDWKRFINEQSISFFLTECEPLRRITPQVPITVNMMGIYESLDYRQWAPHVDVISWDSYPAWHAEADDVRLASDTAFLHDLNRSLKHGKPFMLMESTPAQVNWGAVSRPKRPGMHRLSSLQAVAHGSDTVQYFQWRRSRGACEKFHGAVVDHVGHEHTRVFRSVAKVGEELAKLDSVVGTSVRPQVALIYDWENSWAINMARGPRNENRDYPQTVMAHYHEFWRRGISVDVIGAYDDFSCYDLVVAPMLYMVNSDVGERLTAYVRQGKTLVATYMTGLVDENDLCHLGGWPGAGLRGVFGIWVEETDVLVGHENQTVAADTNCLGLSGEYRARHYASILHGEDARVLATFKNDYYAGAPAVTVNSFGEGQAYYVASRNDDRFLSDFIGGLARQCALQPVLEGELPHGVSATLRTDGLRQNVFVMNFNRHYVNVPVGDKDWTDLLTGNEIRQSLHLEEYGVAVLSRVATL